MPGKLC